MKHQELEKNHQVLENHQIFAEEGMVMFQLQGHDAVLWEVDDNMLGLIVIDDNSGSVVCEKRYRYEDVMLVANFKMTK